MEPNQQESPVDSQENRAQEKSGGDSSIVDRTRDRAVAAYESSRRWVRRSPRRAAIWAGSILLFLAGIFIPALHVPTPHVALSGELIFPGDWFLGGYLTNSILTTLLVDLIVIGLALLATARMQVIPGRWQSFIEMLMEYLYSLCESVAGRDARRFFPWVVTIFLFVIVSNWIGLMPGMGSIVVYQEPAEIEHALAYNRQLAMADGKIVLAKPAAAEEGYPKEIPLFRAPTADLNTTFALALITMVMVQVWGVRELGLGYFGKFFQFRGPNLGMKFISAFVGILELFSEFSRFLAFGFRLFGNIFAGEIVLATMAFLIAYWLPVPFYVLEIFVGFVQALVFMMLALVFFTMATMSHEH